MSMVPYAFCVMNNNIDYSLVLYIRTIRCYKKHCMLFISQQAPKYVIPNTVIKLKKISW